MCSDPQTTSDGQTYACRDCDQCIAALRAEWVGRGMMELTRWQYCTAVTLTYSDETQDGRDGAAMFNYIHVAEWLKRLRTALHKSRPGERLRFLCAGEQGSRNGRCHWHVIVYSNYSIIKLGEVKRLLGGQKVTVTDSDQVYSVGKRKVRVDWSLWPWGFASFNRGDVHSMHYVLSYCLKDRYSVEKSKRSGRITKAEQFVAGMFRMSKRPAIGEDFVWDKLQSYHDRAICPVTLDWQVPGLPGFYHPQGRFRRIILSALNSVNKRNLWATGKALPGWSTLLATYEGGLNTSEVLNGKAKQGVVWETDDRVAREWDFRSREFAASEHFAAVTRRCAGGLPCTKCLRFLSDEVLEQIGVARENGDTGDFISLAPRSISERQQDTTRVWFRYPDGRLVEGRKAVQGVNPYCSRKITEDFARGARFREARGSGDV